MTTNSTKTIPTKCTTCDITFNRTEKSKNCKCPPCGKIYRQEYNRKNKEIIKQKHREYQKKKKEEQQNSTETKTCKTCEKTKLLKEFDPGKRACKKCENKKTMERRDPEKTKAYYLENKDKFKEWQHESYERNKPKIRAKEREQYKNNPAYKLKKTVRSSMVECINKFQKTNKYLNSSSETFKNWLFFCFDENMSFENRGDFWHIEHVIPIDVFDIINNKKECELCFNWRNTSPMNKTENMGKKTCLDEDQIKRHKEFLLIFSDTQETKNYLVEWEKFIEKLKSNNKVKILKKY
jgi:predicted RNA-binding Zn-ribbon protein involved in translation (DUF1610 family)